MAENPCILLVPLRVAGDLAVFDVVAGEGRMVHLYAFDGICNDLLGNHGFTSKLQWPGHSSLHDGDHLHQQQLVGTHL